LSLKRPLNVEGIVGDRESRMLARFSDRIDELESVVKEIALEITTGTFVEKLSPDKVWEKTGDRIALVSELIKELKEYLAIIKPESLPKFQLHITRIYERLALFQETLRGEEAPDQASKLSLDELRQALVEISDFVTLCKETKAAPSEVISTILNLRETFDTGLPPITQDMMHHLGNLIKEAKRQQKEMEKTLNLIGRQLEAISLEYSNLLFSLKGKDEEKPKFTVG
jgi:hypothetical protein